MGRDANLLVGLAADAGMGDDWVSLRTLASHGDSGGGVGVVARMGLEDRGDGMAGL